MIVFLCTGGLHGLDHQSINSHFLSLRLSRAVNTQDLGKLELKLCVAVSECFPRTACQDKPNQGCGFAILKASCHLHAIRHLDCACLPRCSCSSLLLTQLYIC